MPAPPREEISGIVRRIGPVFKDGNGIVRLEDGTCCTGPVCDGPESTAEPHFSPGDEVRFHGAWMIHKTHGRQFKYSSAVPKVATTRTGVLKYLLAMADGKCGLPVVGVVTGTAIAGLGESTITRLVDIVTPALVVDKLSADTEGCLLALKLSMKYSLDATKESGILELGRRVREDSKYREVRVRLHDLFAGRGFTAGTIAASIARWGTLAADRIKRDPFCLLFYKIPGAGYSRAERLYLDLGHNPHKIRRQGFCAWHAISEDRSGSTWVAEARIVMYLGEKITGKVRAQRALTFCKRIGWMVDQTVVENGSEVKVWTTRKRFQEESDIRDEATWSSLVHSGNSLEYLKGQTRIITIQQQSDHKKAVRERIRWPNPALLKGVSDHQREQIAKAFAPDLGIAVLTGGPGTGKTHTTAAIVKAYEEQKLAMDFAGDRESDSAFEPQPIICCAPTGKAAVRASEAFLERKIGLSAFTIHSTLGVNRNGHDGDGWGFTFNKENRIPPALLLVDETSMCDTNITASWLNGVSPFSKILFIGDPDQLPPVGPGAPLRDMIAAGAPHGHLTEIHRFAGRIADACDKIRRGVPWQASKVIDLDNKDFPENLKHVERNKSQIMSTLVEWITSIIAKGSRWGFDPMKDIQVLCATNDDRKIANTVLQKLLNPLGKTMERCSFRVGDKVVCTKNNWFAEVEDAGEFATPMTSGTPKVYVANGDTGFVKSLHPRQIVILFGDRLVAIEPDHWKEIDLAYCLTGHKSQGSQWPVCITLIDDSPVCNRSWYYTCLSRASKLAGLIGPRRAMDICLKRQSLNDRRTQLTEMLRPCFQNPSTFQFAHSRSL